ncbi:MAG: Panacea domain-containing protein [Clostridia bacterium]
MTKVINVAKYIVYYFNSKNSAVSNLKLQKLLYFCQIEKYKTYREWLFEENFQVWENGPVVNSVYIAFSPFVATEIYLADNNISDLKFDESDKKIIDKICETYFNSYSWDLVEKSHETGTAWERQKTQDNGIYRQAISDENLKKDKFLGL